MPDQDAVTTIPEPQGSTAATAEEAVAQGEFSEGNLAKAFDKVFPGNATRRKTTEPAPPIPPKPPVAPVAPKASEVPKPPEAPTAPAPPPQEKDTLLPAELFGEIPTTPKEPTPTEVLPEVEAPEHVKSNPAALKNWEQLRGGYEQRGKELDKIKAEFAETKAKLESGVMDEGLKARMTQLEQENQQFKERQSSIDLQSDPEFQKVFIHGRRRLVEGGSNILKEAGLDSEGFERAMDMNGRARTEALDEIVESVTSTTLRGELTAVIKDLNSLDRSKSQTLADSKNVVERLRQNQRANEFRALQEHEKFLDSTFETVADKLANVSKIGFLREIEGNEEWNKDVRQIKNDAREIVKNSTDYSQLTGAVLLGRAFPNVYNALITRNKQYQEAMRIIAEYKAAEPSLNGGRTGDSDVSTRPDKKLSFAEAVAQSSGLPQ